MRKIKISVTEFAVPVVRSGSLSREGNLLGPELGSEIHKKIQEKNEKNSSYKKEVPLQFDFKVKSFCFQVSGRADGVYDGDDILVQEIKSTFSFETLQQDIEANPLHPYRLQVLTYAYILEHTRSKPVKASLLLVSLKNKKQREIDLDNDPVFYSWLDARLKQLVEQERLRQAQKRKRRGLASTMFFPFEKPRKYQDDLCRFVGEVAQDGATAMLQAPTGIGKTMGVLFPVLQNALSRGSQTLYVTPKNSQFDVVKDAVRQIDPRSRVLKTRIITAKSKLCRMERIDCNPSTCEYARDYYDKVNLSRIPALIKKFAILTGEDLLEIGERYKVCPYQIQMDTLGDADLIVGDYNYVFSPQAALAERFRNQKKSERLSLIIDEAHNLYQRAMEYYSPALDVFACKSLLQSPVNKKIQRKFRKLLSSAIFLIESSRPTKRQSALVSLNLEPFQELHLKLFKLLVEAVSIFDDLGEDDPIHIFYRNWSAFLEVLNEAGEESLISYIFEDSHEILKITCCNPARFLQKALQEFHTTVAFSATLKPFPFYQTMSGFAQDTRTQEYATAFPEKNRKVIIIPQVSTTYKKRERYYPIIGDAIERISAMNCGNYLAFFPSYDFMNRTRSSMEISAFDILLQRRDMNAQDLKDLESRIKDGHRPTLVFAVQGGLLSEGIDINTPHLKGVYVIGPAMPSLSYERELLREFYQQKFGDGFSFAYTYPAMARSIQAAGRVIRSDTKRGLIVMMDARFISEKYTETLPRYWFKNSASELVSQKILADVGNFWAAD